MLLWIVGIVASLVSLWAGYTEFYEGNLGQPEYTVTKQMDDIEFRTYEPFVIATTQLNESGRPWLEDGLSNPRWLYIWR